MFDQPRIFLSSVTNGLSWYRDELREILTANGMAPVEMTSWATPGREVSSLVRSEIDRCHGVICLVGKSHGMPSGDRIPLSEDRFFSYTQLEWLHAFQQVSDGKPMLTLFVKDKAMKDYKEEQAELLKCQADWIVAIKEQLRVPGTRAGHASFESEYEFAKILAKMPWKDWLNGNV